MSAEAIQNLERFNHVITESRSRLEQMAADARSAAAEMAASRERFDGLAREIAQSAPRVLAAVDAGGEQASSALQSVAEAAGAGLPDDVDQLVTQVGTDEVGAVEQVEQDLAASHEEVRGQGLDPLRSAADATESQAREMESQVTVTLEAAFKSVTLGMDAVQEQAEKVGPALTGHMQRYAELASNVSVAGDGFANRVNDGVLAPLGLDAAAAAAAAAPVAGAFAMGAPAGTFDGSGAGLGSHGPGGLVPGLVSAPGAGLIQDGGAYFQQGAGIVAAGGGNIVAAGGGNIVAAGGGNLVTDNGAGIVAAGGGNIVAAGGGNIVAAGGGNIVAAGGGNIVAAGGGNIVAAGGGNLFSDQGAGIVAAGGGNIVAAGGGNIVAAGGGNIVAAGGGNIVAAGGGNLIPKG